MPSELEIFDASCYQMSHDELKREYDHYTRQLASAATSTVISSFLAIPTFGITLVGVGISATMIHEARHKRDIIEEHLKSRKSVHYIKTSKRDVMGSMVASGVTGLCTFGLAPQLADVAIKKGADQLPGKIAREATYRIAQMLAGALAAADAMEHVHREGDTDSEEEV